MLDSIRTQYRVKIVLGYAATWGLVATVGFVTGETAATVLAAAVGLLALGSITGTSTAASVRQLAQASDAVADGELDEPVRSPRVDEIGRLYGSIDEMRRSLAERIETVSTLSDEYQATATDYKTVAAEHEATATAYQQIAESYSDVMSRAAAGDLTARVDVDDEYEAMATIGRAFNETISGLETALAEVAGFAGDVSDGRDTMHDSVTSIAEETARVDTLAAETTAAAREQREQVETAIGEMNDLAATAEEVAATTEEIASRAETTAEMGTHAHEAAASVASMMDDAHGAMTDAVSTIDVLTERTEAVTEVVDIIREISRQTNLLALNASIEAANATDGTGTDGFAVVADEVKSLAEETREQADVIEHLIEQLNRETEDAAAAVRETSETVDTSTDRITETAARLDEIADQITTVETSVAEISRATDDQAQSTERVSATLNAVGDTSTQTVETTTDVRAAVDTQQTAVDVLEDDIEEFGGRATGLVESLDRFVTAVDGRTLHRGPEAVAAVGGEPGRTDGGGSR